MKKWIEKNYKTIIILSSIFLIMLILNSLTPLMSDDFGYSFNLEHERIKGLRDIVNFQIAHYKWWGGRIVAHTLVQLFLIGPKIIFNIFNSLCFTVLIYLMYLVTKSDKKDNITTIPILFFLVYFLQPVFGQCCLWLTGSCNYLWTTTIVLLILYLYIKHSNFNDNFIYITFIFLLGIIAGWTNENTSFSLLTILFLLLIVNKMANKKIKKWQIFGIIGNIIGFTIMILAPGNYIRKDSYVEEISLFQKLFTRFIECTKGIFTYEILILIPFIILICFLIYQNKKINKNSIIFMIGSIMGVYPMVMSPTFPERSWFSIIIFGIISITILINDIKFIGKKEFKYLVICITLILTVLFIPDYIKLTQDINDLRDIWDSRITFFKENPHENEYKFKVYSTTNKKNPMYHQLDIVNDPNGWPNKDISKYFNIKNIEVKE